MSLFPSTHLSFSTWPERIARREPVGQYRHKETGEDSADAHIKRQIIGREVVAAVTDCKLDFERWGQIFYAEFEGEDASGCW